MLTGSGRRNWRSGFR